MPRNPFIPIDESEKINRNGVDLSERRLFTSDFGRIVPFFTKEVLSGDSFEIDASCGLRSMPTLFPIQTRIRMSMEFYYCRNRCVWEDFEDFIFNTKKNLVQPWLKLDNERAKSMISTGSLGDFFRVPTTLGSQGSLLVNVPFTLTNYYFPVSGNFLSMASDFLYSYPSVIVGNYNGVKQNDSRFLGRFARLSAFEGIDTFVFHTNSMLNRPNIKLGLYVVKGDLKSYIRLNYSQTLIDGHYAFVLEDSSKAILSDIFESFDEVYLFPFVDSFTFGGDGVIFGSNAFLNSITSIDVYSQADILDATDDRVIDSNPFVGEEPVIPLNALPFRHYEMLMNYYYRNDKNNPYVLNGVVEYNKFIPSKASGADTNVYDFHYRNFELDQFTSAVQSPQFGEAPLVGLTYNRDGETATLRFQATNVGTGETSDYDVTVGLENDGRISSIVDFDKEVPSANLRKLQEDINAGISINNLRMGNAFQRLLENTYRGSLRYRNQLKSHRGVEVDYPDIDIPQYIGGASDYLESGQVNATAATESTGLGDFNGFISGGVSTKNKIRIYCPENGFIIGVVSFYPIPMYCQNLDKVMQKISWLDYQQPEFNKIGFVPMHYSEVFPLQTPADGSVHDVFAYQKVNYDYMRSYDSVHGDFRTSLRDFTLMRTFKERPVMSQSFTKVYPEQFNDIFATRNIADDKGSSAKFMLSSNVQCIAQRQIAVFGSPALE